VWARLKGEEWPVFGAGVKVAIPGDKARLIEGRGGEMVDVRDALLDGKRDAVFFIVARHAGTAGI
jgi:hypothetical protein